MLDNVHVYIVLWESCGTEGLVPLVATALGTEDGRRKRGTRTLPSNHGRGGEAVEIGRGRKPRALSSSLCRLSSSSPSLAHDSWFIFHVPRTTQGRRGGRRKRGSMSVFRFLALLALLVRPPPGEKHLWGGGASHYTLGRSSGRPRQ